MSVPGSELQGSLASTLTTGRVLAPPPIIPPSGRMEPSAFVPAAHGLPSIPSYIARSTTRSIGVAPSASTCTEKRRPRASGKSSATFIVNRLLAATGMVFACDPPPSKKTLNRTSPARSEVFATRT